MAGQEAIVTGVTEALVRGGAEREMPSRVSGGSAAENGIERAFETAMQDVTNDMALQPVRESQGVQESQRLRAEHAVGASEGGSAGDAILDGLRSIRGMFDEQIERASSLGREKSASNPTDLILAQAEITKFTVMIDVTSKLAGKLTQSCDTLLKG